MPEVTPPYLMPLEWFELRQRAGEVHMSSHNIVLLPLNIVPSSTPGSDSLKEEMILYRLGLIRNEAYPLRPGDEEPRWFKQSPAFQRYLQQTCVNAPPLQHCENIIWRGYLHGSFGVDRYLILHRDMPSRMSGQPMPLEVLQHYEKAMMLVVFEGFEVRVSSSASIHDTMLLATRGGMTYVLAHWSDRTTKLSSLDDAKKWLRLNPHPITTVDLGLGKILNYNAIEICDAHDKLAA